MRAAAYRSRAFEAVAAPVRMGAVGTGFFIDSSGYVVTNSHVILSGVRYRDLRFAGAEWESMRRLLITVRDIWITVGEGEEQRDYLAEPVLIAEDMDLAVLRVAAPPGQPAAFTPLPLARSEGLRVGDAVLSLGFPDDEFQASRGRVLSLIQGYQVNEEMDRRTLRGAGRARLPSAALGPW
jgi:S1-C subfamily serine protease